MSQDRFTQGNVQTLLLYVKRACLRLSEAAHGEVETPATGVETPQSSTTNEPSPPSSGRLLANAPTATDVAKTQAGRTLRNGKKLDYGFGWEVYADEDTGQPVYSHSGLWMGFTSYYLRLPERKLSVIVLSNSAETDTESLAWGTAKLFFD